MSSNMKFSRIPAFLAVSFFVILATLALACASQKKEGEASAPSGAAPERIVEMDIKGMVKIYGNEPHTWVGIETRPEGKVYSVDPPETARELRGQQGYLIEFRVSYIENQTVPALQAPVVSVISWQIAR